MPYVWVDDHVCDGECDKATRLDTAISEALDLIRDGEIAESEEVLGTAIKDEKTEKHRKQDAELRLLYSEWLAIPLPRPDFLSFSHSKRKETRV